MKSMKKYIFIFLMCISSTAMNSQPWVLPTSNDDYAVINSFIEAYMDARFYEGDLTLYDSIFFNHYKKNNEYILSKNDFHDLLHMCAKMILEMIYKRGCLDAVYQAIKNNPDIRLTEEQKYYLQLSALHEFYANEDHDDAEVAMNRDIYKAAWATRNVKKIIAALKLKLHAKPRIPLMERIKNIKSEAGHQ